MAAFMHCIATHLVSIAMYLAFVANGNDDMAGGQGERIREGDVRPLYPMYSFLWRGCLYRLCGR